jgi:hypothetical protein
MPYTDQQIEMLNSASSASAAALFSKLNDSEKADLLASKQAYDARKNGQSKATPSIAPGDSNDAGVGSATPPIPMAPSHKTPEVPIPMAPSHQTPARAGYTPGAIDTLNPADVNTADTDASRAYGQATTMGAIQGTARLASYPLHAAGIISDQTFNKVQNRAKNATLAKDQASANPNLNAMDAAGMGVVANPYTYLTAPFAPATTAGRIAFGGGIGGAFAATEPNSTPGSTARGVALGAGTAGVVEGGLSVADSLMNQGARTAGGAVINSEVGTKVADKLGPVETPAQVLAAAQADPKLNMIKYDPQELHTHAEAGDPLAQQYEARLLKATMLERQAAGQDIPVNAGTFDRTARDNGSLAAAHGSGVNEHNIEQGQSFLKSIVTDRTNLSNQATERPYDFQSPNSPLVPSEALKDSISNANVTGQHTDIVQTSLEGKAAENTTIANQKYAQVNSEINTALALDSTLPKAIDIAPVLGGKGVIGKAFKEPGVFFDTATGKPLTTWQDTLTEKGGQLTYQETKSVVSQIEGDIRAEFGKANPDRLKIAAFTKVKSALDDLADGYAAKVIPDSTSPQDASNFFKTSVVPYRDAKGGVAKIINSIDADSGLNTVFSKNNADKLGRIFPLLDSKGQDALRSEFLGRALDAAKKGGGFDVHALASWLDNRNDQLGTLFGGVDAAGNGTNSIKNIVNMIKNSPQAGAVAVPETLGKMTTKAGIGAGIGAGVGAITGGGAGAIPGAALGAAGEYGIEHGINKIRGFNYLNPDLSKIGVEGADIAGPGLNQPTLANKIALPGPSPEPTFGQPAKGVNPVIYNPNQPKLGYTNPPTMGALGMAEHTGETGLATNKMVPPPSYNPPVPLVAKPMPGPNPPLALGQGTPALNYHSSPGGQVNTALPTPAQYGIAERGLVGPSNAPKMTWEDEMKSIMADRTKISTEEQYDALKPGQAYTAKDRSKGIKPLKDRK